MREFDLLGLNEVSEKVYHKHVEGKQNRFQKEISHKTKLTTEQVETIILLKILGARNVDLSDVYNVDSGVISNIVNKKTFRTLDMPILKRKYKKLGKMVFEYCYDELIIQYNNLPDDLKVLCTKKPFMIEPRDLILTTKMRKSEYNY